MSSGGDREAALAEWARRYQVPIGLAAVFFIVLFSMMLASGGREGSGAEPPRSTVEAAVVEAGHSPCPVCGIARHCNKYTGQCELEQYTPPSCVKGAHYDARAGYCVPAATPKPTPFRSQTLRPPAPTASGGPSPRGSPSPSSPSTPGPPVTPTPEP